MRICDLERSLWLEVESFRSWTCNRAWREERVREGGAGRQHLAVRRRLEGEADIGFLRPYRASGFIAIDQRHLAIHELSWQLAWAAQEGAGSDVLQCRLG